MSDFASSIMKQFRPEKVSVVEFAESEDFCGKPLYPLQRVLLKLMFLEEMDGQEEDLLTWLINGGRNFEVSLSPDIRERRDYCREREFEHFSEIVLVGGRRSSKGHITGIAGAKKVHSVQQITDPGTFFGIDIDKQIYFTCTAASLDQAKKFQFADLYSTITRCKALAPSIKKAQEESVSIFTDSDARNIRRMKELGIKVNTRDWSKLIAKPLAANADTIRGSTSILMIFDEMSKMLPGESRSSAQECYDAAEPSLAQFGPAALIFCNSSPWTKVGQFYEQFELAMRPKEGEKEWYPMRFAIQFPSWTLYDKWWLDQRWRHSIMVSPEWEDQVEEGVPESKLDASAIDRRTHEQLREKANPETYKVERRAQWAETVDAYLEAARVDAAYSGTLPDGRPCRQTRSTAGWQFDYKAHCDPSSTTAGFGFAMAHVEEFADTTGLFPGGVARHVVFDRVLRWNPRDFPGETINYIKVREDLQDYMRKFRPSELTFDQFQSTGLSQELREYARKMGFTETRLSIITATAQLNWQRWETFKTALYLGLVHVPIDCKDPQNGFDHSEWSQYELKFLQEKPAGQIKRVDKQDLAPIRTKDIADCICEVTNKFLASYIGDLTQDSVSSARARFGSEGGYPIGGRTPGGPMGQESSARSQMEQFYGDKKFSNPTRTRGIMRNRRRG